MRYITASTAAWPFLPKSIAAPEVLVIKMEWSIEEVNRMQVGIAGTIALLKDFAAIKGYNDLIWPDLHRDKLGGKQATTMVYIIIRGYPYKMATIHPELARLIGRLMFSKFRRIVSRIPAA